MNGVYDLGGTDGFTLPERDEGFPLEEAWERQLWGTILATANVPGLGGGFRSYLERMPPALYLRLPYYAKWLYVREQMLVDSGLATAEELADPEGPIATPLLPADFRPASPAQVIAFLSTDTSDQLDVDVPARFAVGDGVVVRNEHPRGHTRVPRYTRGRRGTIVARHGVHRFQDDVPAGADIGPQPLYTVALTARELWGERGHANDVIHVDLWEIHLEPA